MKKREVCFVFALGAALYSMVEVLYRGSTHWTMALTGGLCMTLIHGMNKMLCKMKFFTRCVCSCFLITTIEYLVGVVVNIKCRMNIWDYSSNKFQFRGQVCLLYSFFWFLLSIPALLLSGGVCRYEKKHL